MSFILFLFFLCLYFYFIYGFTFTTCVYIIWATSHPPPPLRQNLFYPLVLLFCWKNTFKIKRKTAFSLIWGEDSYTGRFLVLFPCICVLQPIMVHLCETSSLLPSLLPIAASANLRLLYLLLYSEHINHIRIFSFLLFPYPSCVQSPLSV
jgi:hypothetical protein